jgi:CRISPR-associated protein Cmr2
MKYLFLMNIGPVQEFIANARRIRDLQFGSWFLSELSRAAAHEIWTQNGSLIFPAPESMEWLQPGHSFIVANRILALVEQHPGELAVLIRSAIFRRLHEIRDAAYQGISISSDLQTIAYLQIDDVIELMWVALPCDENNYHKVLQQLETLMAARKNTYDFRPIAWGKEVPKSSLDGQLESVIPENEYPNHFDADSEKQQKNRLLYERYGAGPAERLSGVDLLKRHGAPISGIGFQSTSHMAAVPFLQRMEVIKKAGHQTLLSAWNTYIETLRHLVTAPQITLIPPSAPSHFILGRNDASLLFEERLAETLNLPISDTTRSTTLLVAQQSLYKFYHVLDYQFLLSGFSSLRPSTYYALLQADGDDLEDAIDAQAAYGVSRHMQFSRAISRFAGQVRRIISKHRGALVYAGGDDVLAFLPLQTVLSCAQELATEFHRALKDFSDNDGHSPTLSMGIAIVHHLDSLREARRLAHRAEQQAKNVDGKNALAITVSKRSGEEYRIVGKWGNIDTRLYQLLKYCRAASIPIGMAYELRDLVLRLSVATTDPQYETLQEVIRLDTLRILLRKLTVPAGKLPLDQIEEIETFLRTQLNLPPREQKGSQNTAQVVTLQKKTAQVSVEMFLNELVIAQILAEAQELAHPGEGVKL